MSEKNLDSKGRWRSKIISFRMSSEEAKLLDDYVSVSGLNKHDYLINRVLQRDVVVQGNIRTFRHLNIKLDDIYKELCRIKNGSEVSEEMICLTSFIAAVLKEIEVNSHER